MKRFTLFGAFALVVLSTVLLWPLMLLAQGVPDAATSVKDICTNFSALPGWVTAVLGFAIVNGGAGLLTNFKWAQPGTPIGKVLNVLALYFRKE